jgi:hypothetical protein
VSNRPVTDPAWTGRSVAGTPVHGWRSRTVALIGAAVLAAAGVATATAASSEAASSVTVTVDASSAKATIHEMGQGLNVAVWDGHMNDADQPALLKGAGIRALRYPGGSYGDLYHWKDNSAPDGYVAPNTGFDAFMATAKAAGAQPVLIANYGSGTAQEAADWVTYANKTKGYGVKYWEIGNEIYGNGHYASGWEKDDHADKSPKAYATNSLEFISKMKAADPSIKIGVVLTTPGNWPDGSKADGDTADWNNTVLSIVGDKADFGIIHWYPSPKSATDSLGKPAAEIATMTSALRSLYDKYNAPNMGIAVTEMNAGYQNDSATAGLVAADSYLTWWENGVFNLDWWQLRNGNDGKTSTNDDGTTDYNEAGIVSVGGDNAPPVNTPFPTYYGLAMAGRIGNPGDTLVSATSSSKELVAHAAKTASGGVNVMLINEDLQNSTSVSLSGVTATGNVTVEQWKKGATSISSTTQASASSITVPPYSITLLKTGGDDGPAPTSTTDPVATTDPAATTVPAATTDPAVTTVPAATTSAPVPAPVDDNGESATCTAEYQQRAAWQGGFLGDVTVTNTGSTPVTGWTVRLTLAEGQTLINVWNGKNTGTTGTVSVTNASYNGSTDAKGTQVFGFVANGNGSAAPTVAGCTTVGGSPSPTSPTTSPATATPSPTVPPTTASDPTTASPTSTNAGGGGSLPSSFAWSDQGPLISPKFPESMGIHAIKDASVVKYNGEYLVYASTVSSVGYSLAYTHFSDFSQASEAPQYHLSENPNIGDGYRAAPQVFYFAPKKTWYLVYQQGPPAYSTTSDPTKPETWSAPTNFFGGWDVEPDVLTQNKGEGSWLDFAVICDDVNCHLFFTDGTGNLYRSQTTVADFPNGFTSASTVLALKGTKGNVFEGSNIYKVKGTDTYLLLVEGFGDDGKRVFRSWTTTDLAGEWKPMPTTGDNLFASAKNVTWTNGKWSNDISHGDAVRDNPDQTSEIDPCNLRFMYQGLAPDATGDYNSLPWRLGLLTLTNATC